MYVYFVTIIIFFIYIYSLTYCYKMEQANDPNFYDFDVNPDESVSQVFADVQSETTDNVSTTLSKESIYGIILIKNQPMRLNTMSAECAQQKLKIIYHTHTRSIYIQKKRCYKQ